MPTLTIYNYHPITKELLSISEAQQDPQDAENWLIPAHATSVDAPPAGVNEVEVFDESTKTWSLQPDYRGQKYWLADGSEIEITEIGITPPVDALSEQPLKPLAEYKTAAALEVDQAAGAARSRFVSTGKLIEQEYQLAERQAHDYITNGGAVPQLVQHWADLTTQTADEAATDITAKASLLYAALALIRTARLTAKKSITDAADHSAVATALTAALTAIEAITPTTTGS